MLHFELETQMVLKKYLKKTLILAAVQPVAKLLKTRKQNWDLAAVKTDAIVKTTDVKYSGGFCGGCH